MYEDIAGTTSLQRMFAGSHRSELAFGGQTERVSAELFGTTSVLGWGRRSSTVHDGGDNPGGHP